MADETRDDSVREAELKPCEHCGAVPVDPPNDNVHEELRRIGAKLIYHAKRCYRREPMFEILHKDNIDLWNTRADSYREWQPIETAPRAGRFLIGGGTITGRSPPFHIEICKYRNGRGLPIFTDDDFEATHWMPLPSPERSANAIPQRPALKATTSFCHRRKLLRRWPCATAGRTIPNVISTIATA